MIDQLAKAKTIQALHDRGCFLIPNPWDAGLENSE